MSCGFLSEAQVCDEPYRSFNHWSVCMVMYTNPVVRARLVAQPVSMLEARPIRASCAALFLILVKTNWNGLFVSRGKSGCINHCASFVMLSLTGTMNCALIL